LDKEKIEKDLDEIVNLHFGESFRFRKYQKELIIDIVKTILEGTKKSYVIEAPTGSGKSIIALATARLLNKYDKKGYILASDLSLQSQYEIDLERYQLHWGSVKGVDNYNCIVNNEKHSLGECVMKNIPSGKRRFLSCYKDCPYYQARDKAIGSHTSILNYSYFLIARNYIDAMDEIEMWGKRDFVICDEAHKVTDIVQNHFSPRIDISTNAKLEKLREFFISKEFGSIKVTKHELSATIDKLFKLEDVHQLQNALSEFQYQLSFFNEKANDMKSWLARKYAFKTIPTEFRYGAYLVDWVKDLHCKFEDFNVIIKETGVTSLIKNPSDEGVTFNCLDESYLMIKHMWDMAGFPIVMSATIGDSRTYVKSTKLEEPRSIRVPSTFNFEESPIYAFTGKKMSFNEKEQSFPWAVEKIKEIAELHKGQNGIIQTGSYNFAIQLMKKLPKDLKSRILTYNSSEEKKEALRKFAEGKDKILIGPSILEGLNFDEDMSRFQVILKLPYPSLMDRFVAAKLKSDQDWYNMKTTLQILQGIGRSVRNERDWAKTYILDGCFAELYRRNQGAFSKDFNDRLIWVPYHTKNWPLLKPVKLPI